MEKDSIIETNRVHFYYGKFRALTDISMRFQKHRITALIGPSGCGKSTLLRLLNRMNDLIPEARVEGEVVFEDRDIYGPDVDPVEIRKKIGMVFQKPNPLPMSIYRNVAFPLKLAGVKDEALIRRRVETALKEAFLWDEVKDRLEHDARDMSGGQQQRLCIARALIVGPEVLLMDEPTSSLDHKAASIIEELIVKLKTRCTILLVSHLMEQVSRLADTVMELDEEKLITRQN